MAPVVLLGRYQLLERVGEGGMGVVWRSFDLELEESVAVKFLRADLARDRTRRAAFQREARLARRISHSNVARVLEFAQDGELYFLTMEFIDGESLQDLLAREGGLPPGRLLSRMIGACKGLAAAHAAGVVHGDLKPGNLLLAPGRGAVLTDFGIARALAEDGSDEPPRHGTPQYMAPEQLQGAPPSLRSDVFAAGLLMFEALTGRLPWPTRDTRPLLEYRRAGGEPELARRPDLPAPWASLIHDCLQLDPQLRPADGQALVHRLTDLRRGTASSTPIDPIPQRHPISPSTAAGPTWLTVAAFSSESGAGDDAYAWICGDLFDALTQVRELRVAAPRERADGPMTQVRGQIHPVEDGVVVDVQVLAATGVVTHEFRVHQTMAALPNLGADLAAKIADALVPTRAGPPAPRDEDMPPRAAELYVQARNEELALRPFAALRLYEDALRLAPHHRLLQLGHLHAKIGRTFFDFRLPDPEEVADLRVAVELATREHGETAAAIHARTSIAFALGESVECARQARRALRLAPSQLGAHIMLADVLLDIGRLPDAERRLEIALALNPRYVLSWTLKARLLAHQGRWDEFLTLVDGTLAELRYRSPHVARLLLWHPDPAALARLARVYAVNADNLPRGLCQVGQALTNFGLGRGDRRAVLDTFVGQPGFTHPRHARFVLQARCELACVLGDTEQALALLAEADAHALHDWSWIEGCPLLAPLRDDPRFIELRGRVRLRADAVAEALWSGA